MLDWVNIANPKYHCQILHISSTHNGIMHMPEALLTEGTEHAWVSGEGLPQAIVLSLEKVQFPYQKITGLAFTVDHDYESNPKTIEVWAARDRDSAQENEFVFWEKMQMRKKRGKQVFTFSGIPQSQRIIKIVITETYGEFNTYLHQIAVLAEPRLDTSKSLFDQEIGLETEKSPEARHFRRKQNPIKTLVSAKTESNFDEQSPLNMLDRGEQGSSSRHKQSDMELDDINEKSYQQNAQMLAMSKNMLVMEDNIEDLNRRVEVLEKKLAYTYENLEANIMHKVDDIIEKKIERQLSQKQLTTLQNKQVKSSKDLATSRTLNQGSSRGKEKKVMGLVAELNSKLRQRVKLAKRLEERVHRKPKSQYYD